MFAKLARAREMTLAAELQNALLPPRTVGNHRMTVSGVIEPAYEVGGDVFDVSLDSRGARLAVMDSVGHDLQAGLVASVAIGAFRNGRRGGGDLRDTAAAVDQAVEGAFVSDRFATAVFADIDATTGELSWINCGHPRPVLLRAGKMVKTLSEPAGLPIGLGYNLPETLRRIIHAILDRHAGLLQDDATILVVEWNSDAHEG